MRQLNLPASSRLLDQQILASRGPKNKVDPWHAYASFVEQERSAEGVVEPVATLLLTNRECPLRCTMCDLWKNTLDQTTPLGAIPHQIKTALETLPAARHVKLYNSGNFFDRRAIPFEDHEAIARAVDSFATVIVENHPLFVSDQCHQFQERLAGQLEVAIGLETVHEETLTNLNKRMNLDDVKRAVEQLRASDIHVRTFILLKPPGMEEREGIDWAMRTIEFSFAIGARACTVIPTRAGNGMMEQLQQADFFQPPSLKSLETVIDSMLPLVPGRLFADLWDAKDFATCQQCCNQRIERMSKMNLTQEIEPQIKCAACSS